MINEVHINVLGEGEKFFEYAPSWQKFSHPSCVDPIEAPGIVNYYAKGGAFFLSPPVQYMFDVRMVPR